MLLVNSGRARKIGPVPRQVLSPCWKIKKECNVCDTAAASALQSLPSWQSSTSPTISFFHLPHSPLAMVISPPLGYHMISRDGGEKKGWCSTTTVGLVEGCSRWEVVWGTGEGGARPARQPAPAFQWENSCSPSQLTIYFKLYQSKPTRWRFVYIYHFYLPSQLTMYFKSYIINIYISRINFKYLLSLTFWVWELRQVKRWEGYSRIPHISHWQDFLIPNLT